MCCDTTVCNTGIINGVYVILKQLTNKNILYLLHCHQILYQTCTEVNFRTEITSTSNLDIALFRHFQIVP